MGPIGATQTCLQNSFSEPHTLSLASRKALRALNTLGALRVYPFFEDEKSNESDEKSVKQKIAKKDHSTNIIAAKLVREHLKKCTNEQHSHL